ncbi:MAG: DUF4145 domain-containing protein [Rhodobacteraceae bacterium]|nr:DUF4145 domain-containing protein [Paracoccaceae bacterium]
MERFFLVYPRLTGTLPPEAEPEMPQSMRRNYDEAKDIFAQSPRGAAALLRLAVQNLCIHLKNHRPHLKLKGRNLKEDIAILQKKGLPENIVNALDVVRVIGNNAIHPGQMDAEDDRERVEKLFRVVNHIVRWTISDHNLVDDMHKDLPEALRRVLKGKGKGKPGSDDSKPPNPENP